jgi:hypothetical protein
MLHLISLTGGLLAGVFHEKENEECFCNPLEKQASGGFF